jgi:aryl-phospho-beta-D-glucosidase BglC (GH1 family)
MSSKHRYVRVAPILFSLVACDPAVSGTGDGAVRDAGADGATDIDGGTRADGGAAADGGTSTDAGATSDAGSDAGIGPITAAEAAVEMVGGFNVGNTFDANQHPRTPSSVNAMVDAYYDEGFRMVRIPVRWLDTDWGEGLLADDAGVVDRAHPRLAHLESAVDHALGRGMYVVLNTHHEDWLFDNAWSEDQLAIFSQLWSDVCDIFKDRGYNLVFEIVNEPHGTIEHDSTAVQALNQTAYDRIRACGGNNPERIIIIDGEDWGSPASLRATWSDVADIPGGGDDPYLMGSIHYYSPLALTHADDAGGIDTPWTVDAIRTSFDNVAAWAEGRLPIYVGELGVNWNQHAHEINDNVIGWYAAVAAETIARGWAFAVWDDGGWFRVMDRDDQQFNGLQDACIPE